MASTTQTTTDLIDLVRKLTEQIQELSPLQLPVDGPEGDLRETILLYLSTKVLPELGAAEDLPVFIGVQGGTNVGKSTVFNALAGKLLSPGIVQASATKHPLVFVHERWRQLFLEERPFPDTTYAELGDAKDLLVEAERTDLLYFRFHNDDALADLALIDSPDFDSALLSNLEVARRIAALSDITIFVTTAQKYRDRELVKHLRLLSGLKANVLMIFNMVDEEIVYQTLVDDLESTLPLKQQGVKTLRLGTSSAQYPEEEFREPLRASVLEHLAEFEHQNIKSAILRQTLGRVLDHVGDLRARFEPELRFKENLHSRIEEGFEKETLSYSKDFELALPEETLGVKKLVQLTELWRHLELIPVIQEGSRSLSMVGSVIKGVGEGAHNLLLRFSHQKEGDIDEAPGTLADYEKTRNDSDFERVLRASDTLRTTLESFCRSNEDSSPLARELMARFFTPEYATGLVEESRKAFDRECADPRVNPDASGSKILRDLDLWLERHGFLKNIIFVVANLLKIFCGLFAATLLPPDSYFFSLLNWVWFILGYLAGAYAIALVISFAVRRKARFKKARVEGMRAVLERVIVKPLGESLDEILVREDVDAIGTTAKKIAALPDA